MGREAKDRSDAIQFAARFRASGWVRGINEQCRAAGVSHFFKQAYINEKRVPCETPLLDGEVVQQFPVVPGDR